jgi:hypothetical protein
MQPTSAVKGLFFFAVLALLGLGLMLWPTEPSFSQRPAPEASAAGAFTSLPPVQPAVAVRGAEQGCLDLTRQECAPSTPAAKFTGKKIRDIRVGERILGQNPIREQAEGREPNPKTWRHISLHIKKSDGRALWIELLRPVEWVTYQKAETGKSIWMDLPEMGARGEADVIAISDCPAIQPGSGTVVTGTFKHECDGRNVVLLQIEDQEEPTKVTTNHPYWSTDREEFVAVGQLQVGEQVDTEHGLRKVVSITPFEYKGFLYNLETTEHVYRVGSLGTLVHNSCPVERAANAAGRFGGKQLSNPNHFHFPNRNAARRAASEIAGNLGADPRKIRLGSDYRGVPPHLRNSKRVLGKESADGSAGWRDDFLGHSRFDAPPHVNAWADGFEFHLFYDQP